MWWRGCGPQVKWPPFMVIGGKLHQGKKAIAGEGGGPLGGLYDPFRLEYDPVHGTRIPALKLLPDLTPERLQQRTYCRVRRSGTADRPPAATHALDDYRSQAFSMLTTPALKTMFDLTCETQKTIDRYGRTRFGQSCLLGRLDRTRRALRAGELERSRRGRGGFRRRRLGSSLSQFPDHAGPPRPLA